MRSRKRHFVPGQLQFLTSSTYRRAHDRILKVSRTIANLEGRGALRAPCLRQAGRGRAACPGAGGEPSPTIADLEGAETIGTAYIS
jgi:predicted ATPase with chaperone activity